MPGESSAYGYAHIIDISDEENPKIVSEIMDEVHDRRQLRGYASMSLQKSAAVFSTIPLKDAMWTVRRIRRWPLADREV